MHRNRGIQNILLRRVRRHQSMTALFRSPHTRLEKYSSQPWTAPVTQTQFQDSSLDEQAHISDSSIRHNTPARPTVARQAVSTSTPVTTNPERPKSPSSKEISSSSDPIWKRLQTIFREHQEQDEAKTPNTPDESMPSLESNIPETHQAQIDEAHPNKLAETIGSDKHALSFQDPMTIHPLARSIQRSPENEENKGQSGDSQLGKKNQPGLSLPAQAESMPEAETGQAQTGNIWKKEMTETLDRAPVTEHLPQQSVPLEAVWNIQRVEAAHPLVDETDNRSAYGSHDTEERDTSLEISQVHRQNFDVESITPNVGNDHSAEIETFQSVLAIDRKQESHEPAEVLPPSLPRPSQANLPPRNASIQREVENSEITHVIGELPPVNTPIGPLPADLWWLLGEKPPSSRPASKINNERSKSFSQKEFFQDQRNVSNPEISAEKLINTSSMPNVIQRQTVSDEPLPSNRPKQVSSPRAEETIHTESELDDLARRVYAEVRRRLKVDWERKRQNL